MNYEESQSLANDLLAGSAHPDPEDMTNGLHAPDLWSDFESESAASSDDGEDAALQSTMSIEQLKSDVRGAVRFKSRNAKKPPRKGRTAPETEPTFEIQGMLRHALRLFFAQDLDAAIAILEEVIRIDSNVFDAYRALGEIYNEKGDLDKYLFAWMHAALLRPKEAYIWSAVAPLSRDLGHIDQADFCYTKLAQANPQDVDVLWDRAELNRDNGRNKKAIEIFKQILKLIPYEMTIVRELARLYLAEHRPDDALSLYEETSNHYMSIDSSDLFNWSELNIMAELYIIAAESRDRPGEWRRVISQIKTVARWLRGRQSETWWNATDNDAEWDRDDARRELEPHYAGSNSREAFDMPVELRVKLGRARLKLKDKSEAMRHFENLEIDESKGNLDLILEIADALLNAEAWDEALEYYIRVSDDPELSGPELWLSMARAFKATEDFSQAEECLNAVLASDPADSQTMVLLAELYESTDRRQEALAMINRIIEMRRPEDEDDTENAAEGHQHAYADEASQNYSNSFGSGKGSTARHSSKQPIQSKKTRKPKAHKQVDLQAFEKRKTEETKTRFKALELSHSGMLGGEFDSIQQWMGAASDLVDEFRNIRHFYPSDRKHIFRGIIRPSTQSQSGRNPLSDQLQGIADRLEDSITAGEVMSMGAVSLSHFRGFHFWDWLEVFLQYSLLLVHSGDFDGAYSVMEAAAGANVFYQDHTRFMRIQMMKMILTISAIDSKAGAEQARWMMLHCLFRNDGYRFYGFALSSGLSAAREYNDNANQKFMLRMIKTMDSLLDGRDIAGTIKVKDIDGDPESARPKSPQALILALYGQIIAIGRGYTPSLHYFARALHQRPTDPLLIFSIGLAYLHRSMQRQSDNRHLQIMQAFSFLLQYRDLRKKTGNMGHAQETQYNIGRALHQLGLVHLALRHYEIVVAFKDVEARYDLRYNAAYNMQLIYALSGNTGKAREIVTRYLTI